MLLSVFFLIKTTITEPGVIPQEIKEINETATESRYRQKEAIEEETPGKEPEKPVEYVAWLDGEVKPVKECRTCKI